MKTLEQNLTDWVEKFDITDESFCKAYQGIYENEMQFISVYLKEKIGINIPIDQNNYQLILSNMKKEKLIFFIKRDNLMFVFLFPKIN
jgi:hypothetical protein